jgi:lysophospholipase L1-like esterase
MREKGCQRLKKRSGLTIISLTVASALTVVIGQMYSSRQEDRMFQNSLYAQSDSSEQVVQTSGSGESEESTEAAQSSTDLISEYQANEDSLSEMEWLHYQVLTNGNATLAYYGDIHSSEQWYSELNALIHNQTDNGVTIVDSSSPETDTYDLYINQTSDSVVEADPDMVIFGLPALADKIRDIGLAETEQYLSSLFTSLTSNEGTRVVAFESHPYPGEMDNVNSRSLDYRSYLNTMNEVAADYDITVLPTHDAFLDAVEESGSTLNSFFQDDQVTLNEQGAQLFVEVMSNLLSE